MKKWQFRTLILRKNFCIFNNLPHIYRFKVPKTLFYFSKMKKEKFVFKIIKNKEKWQYGICRKQRNIIFIRKNKI